MQVNRYFLTKKYCSLFETSYICQAIQKQKMQKSLLILNKKSWRSLM